MRPEVWPQPFELKLNWLDKTFTSIENPSTNLNNICTALDFLNFLTTILKPDQLLAIIRPIQKGLSACIIHQNTKIIRLMHILVTRLMALYVPDLQHKNEDLDILYSAISKTIMDNLTFYEKSPQPNPSSLFGTLMILKACCSNSPEYIDRIMLQFIRVLNRLTKEHINVQNNPQANNQSACVESNHLLLELLILSLDMIKNRVVIMSIEVRKLLIGSIIVSLIEKSNDVKILKCIVKILDEWIRVKDQNPVVLVPSVREKSVLLVKIMQCMEKKFPDDVELNIQFLEMVNYIYRDEYLKQTELCTKLEGAFLTGLRSHNPSIRAKFFEVIDASMRRRLHDRLMYIISSQAWDSIGTHYWIKQCIELLILTANTMTPIQNANDMHKIPSITSIINLADTEEKSQFVIYTSSQMDCMDIPHCIDDKDEEFDVDVNLNFINALSDDNENSQSMRRMKVCKLINRQIEFLEISRKIRTDQLLVATSQLCHMDTSLAENVWLSMFPKIWTLFTIEQQHTLAKELVPFLASGTNIIQRDCTPSALNTFVESLTHCNPRIFIPPNLCTYLGKAHNLWHRMTLVLEEMSLRQVNSNSSNTNSYSQMIDSCSGENSQQEYDISDQNITVNECLSQLYSAMSEEDLWAGLWMSCAHYPETIVAISYEQMGFFEEAQSAYDMVMTKFKEDISVGTFNANINSEVMLWEEHWIICAKELNQWDILLDYAQMTREQNEILLMEGAWRIPDWNLMKISLSKMEQAYSKQYGYKVNLFKGFLAILHPEDRQLCNVDKYVEIASSLCIREWRRLPHIVSHIHLQYLQAAQQIIELHEASQIHQGLLQSRSTPLHDMKAIVKTWRNRLPVVADNLSHWSDIFTWRQHHYQVITQHLEQQTDQNNIMLGVHASAQAIIYFGKIARKHYLTGVCQETLSRIYTIPSVPIVDCFQVSIYIY